MVTSAGPPEILRSAQRDDAFQKQLTENASQLVSAMFGVHRWIRWRHALDCGSKFLYQTLTTLGGLQTLGEEYTGIIHWTSAQKLPKKEVQLIMILLNCFGERILLDMVGRFENTLKKLPSDHALRPEAKAALLRICEQFKKFLPFLVRLHQAIFYFEGRYYHVSKRVTGIQYALVRFWLRDRSVLPTFRILGVISILYLFVMALASLRHDFATSSLEQRSCELVPSAAANCSLCLNSRSHTSCTPCGHLFCWSCIVPWVLEQPFCPLCRQDVHPSRIVLLHNFST